MELTFNDSLRNANGYLLDGNYEVRFDRTGFTRDGLQMANDFVYGDIESEEFYVLYGDSDGDRDVDGADVGAMIGTFFKAAGDPAFREELDYDGDDDVDAVDFSFFIQRFFTSMAFN